jgi:hypothetical protein
MEQIWNINKRMECVADMPPRNKIEMKIQVSKRLLKMYTQNIEDPTHP